MLKMNKKAGVVLTMSVVGFVLVVGFILIWSASDKINDFIGSLELDLLSTAKEAEKSQFFIERASDVAAKNALFETVSNFSSCKTYLGYTKLGEGCVIDSDAVKQLYLANFKRELDKTLLTYSGANLFRDNFDVVMSETAAKDSETASNEQNNEQAKETSAFPEIEWPLSGTIKLNSCYGLRTVSGKSQWHDGIDLDAVENADAKSPADGVVVSVCNKWQGECKCSTYEGYDVSGTCRAECNAVCPRTGYGNYVIVKHSDNFYTAMHHLNDVLVKEGDKVTEGQVIAKVGNTGYSEGPHIDFKVYFGNTFGADIGQGMNDRNPLCYLPQNSDVVLGTLADSCKDADGTAAQFCPAFAGASTGDSISLRGTAKKEFIFGKGDVFENVKMTAYRISLESDYDVWSTGELPTEKGQKEGTGFCSINEDERGFYEDVLCQGTGLSAEGNYYYYETMTHSKATSLIGTKKQTASGTELIAHRTVATAPDMIPTGSTVKITYKGCKDQACCDFWSGIYVAEDTGNAMIEDWKKGIPHIDVFAGYGKAASKEAFCIGLAKANVEVISEKLASGKEKQLLYYIKPNFFTKLGYSFTELDQVASELTLISEQVSKKCSGTDKKTCINGILNEKQVGLKWSSECETQEVETLFSLAEAMSLCFKSGTEGYCELPLTSEMKGTITIKQNNAEKSMKLMVGTTSLYAGQQYPSMSVFKEDKLESTTCEEVAIDIQNKKASIKGSSCGGERTKIDGNYDGNIVLYNEVSPMGKVNTISFLPGNFDKNKIAKIETHLNEYRICAQSKYNLLMNGKLEPLIYKVAFSPEDKVPPEKAAFSLKQKENSENVVILEITKQAAGAAYYEIYYSENSFDAISEGITKTRMETSETSKEFIMAKSGTYYFAVVPVDEKENKAEIIETTSVEAQDNLKPSPAIISGVSVVDDTLPSFKVDITKPETNVDGSALTDLSVYSFYLSEAIGLDCSITDAPRALRNKIEPISSDLSSAEIRTPSKDNTHCLLVIAEDENPGIIDESRYSSGSIAELKT